MKKLLLTTLCLIVFFGLNAQTEGTGIVFRNITFEEALKAARAENKMVYVHGYTDWCHYCKDMVENVYPDSAVGAFYNPQFICIKVNLEKEGAELNKRILSHTFPTLLFFDSTGTVMHRGAGRYAQGLLIQFGQEAIDPRRRLHTWIRLFNEGDCSYDTAYRFLRKMEIAGPDFQPEVLKYLNRKKPAELTSADNWKIINELYKDVRDPFMLTLIRLKPDFETLYTKPVVDKKFKEMYKYEFAIRIRLLDTVGFEKLKQQVKASGLDLADQVVDYADLQKAKMKSDYKKYFALAEPFIMKYAENDAAQLNEIAQTFYEKTKDKELLSKAVKWARKSVEMNDTYTYNETLAGILILLEQKEEARKVTLHAIEIGEKNRNNVTKAKLFLEKVEEMP
jgi:thiol-disulfide isomerase/thioredoxin